MTVEVTTLASGLRVATHRMTSVETVSIGLHVARGARHESDSEHGISHFLEHMAFKGTPTRTARGIAEEIEAVGGEINAATGMEATAYYARVLKGDDTIALDVIADIIQNPLFTDEEIEREREVILQEIAASQDVPDDIVYDLAEEAAFTGQPLGRPILGTRASVSEFAADEFRAYLATHYRGGEMVLSAAGNLDHDRLVKCAEAAFASLPAGSGPPAAAARYHGGRRTLEKGYEQSHLVLGFSAPGYLDRSHYAAQVLSGLFGGGMSSRLFQEAREARGLCYSIYSFAWGFADAGLFGVHAATGPEEIDRLAEVIAGEIGKIAGGELTGAEIRRSKAQLKASMLMSLESTGLRAEQMARQLIAHGRPLTVDEIIAGIEAVSQDDLTGLATEIFLGSATTWSEVGPAIDRGARERFAGTLDRMRTRH